MRSKIGTSVRDIEIQKHLIEKKNLNLSSQMEQLQTQLALKTKSLNEIEETMKEIRRVNEEKLKVEKME